MAHFDAHSIRTALASRLGLSSETADQQIRESILVKSGFYCGRRFTCQGYSLTWFIEEDQVKLIGPDGSLVCSMASSDFIGQQPMRRAA